MNIEGTAEATLFFPLPERDRKEVETARASGSEASLKSLKP